MDDFSADNHGHCFLHVVNLIAKSFLKQFDVKKKRGGAASDDVELDELVEEVEQDEVNSPPDGGEDDKTDDDLDGWVDKVEKLTEEEQELLECIKLIKRVLFKVSTWLVSMTQCDLPL